LRARQAAKRHTGAAALLRHVVAQERLGNEWPGGLYDEETDFDNED
jgi:hypothetical protein